MHHWRNKRTVLTITYINGLVQERRNSIANALELVFLALTHRHVTPGKMRSFTTLLCDGLTLASSWRQVKHPKLWYYIDTTVASNSYDAWIIHYLMQNCSWLVFHFTSMMYQNRRVDIPRYNNTQSAKKSLKSSQQFWMTLSGQFVITDR